MKSNDDVGQRVGELSVEEPGSKKRISRWLRVEMGAARWLIGGLFIAATSAAVLAAQRAPQSGWHDVLNVLFAVTTLLVVVEAALLKPWLGFEDYTARKNPPEGSVTLLFFAAWAVLVFQRNYSWTAIGVGVITALYFWMRGRERDRFPVAAIVGWLVAGLIAYHAHWPRDQAFLLAVAIGGLATAAQGAWDVPYWHEKSSQGEKG